MTDNSKTQKRRRKLKKNAMQRSETVWKNNPPPKLKDLTDKYSEAPSVYDEAAYFLQTGKLLDVDETKPPGEADILDLLDHRLSDLGTPDDIAALEVIAPISTPQTLEELQAKMNDKTPYICLDRPKSGDEGMSSSCTCGGWSYGPTTKLSELGAEAKKHQAETGHKLRGV